MGLRIRWGWTDDLALLSTDHVDAQCSLNIAAFDAQRNRYRFNTLKSKVVSINHKPNVALYLNKEPLDYSTKEVHIGIARNPLGSNSDTVNDRVKSARRSAYNLMGAGFHGLNGAGTKAVIKQYKVYILPILLYGLEALILRDNEIACLEKYHRQVLRQIQHLPPSTASSDVYLLSGVLPVEAFIHIRILNTFRGIMDASPDTAPVTYLRDLFIRQLALKDVHSKSYVSYVRRLLSLFKYLPLTQCNRFNVYMYIH